MLLLLLHATLVALWHLLLVRTDGAKAEPALRTCEPIKIEMCSGLGYNLTGMPNLGGNELQQEADYTLKTFAPLIQYGCSSQLKLFLCSVYVPMCTEKVPNPIGPCRNLCENVRSRCFPVLQGFGFPWPDALNCSRFPEENNHDHMCMEGPREKGVDPVVPPVTGGVITECPPYYTRGPKGGCIAACDSDLLFDGAEKKFAEVWVTVWAVISFTASLFAALTLSIGGGRLKARPLVSIALCYCLISVGWALRIISGRTTTSCGQSADDDGLSNINCAFVFLLIYYFGMAATVWWVGLCAWWLARGVLCCSPERLRTLGSVSHVVAWGLPAALTVAALVRRDVDPDELTGTCNVGNRNTATLFGLVLVPFVLYLTTALIILLLGYGISLRQPRPSAAAPLTGSAPRPASSDLLGVLCTLYFVPVAGVFATLCYEYANREKWLGGVERPALWVFLLRYFMELFVGVSAVFWIWSRKTVTAWRAVLRRLGPRKQLPIKCQTVPVLRYVPASPPVVPLHAASSTTSRHSGRSHTQRKPKTQQQQHHRKPIII